MSVDLAAIEAGLLAAGGPFEIGEEDVLGERMPVFVRRAPSLRTLLERSVAFGDAEHLVFHDGGAVRRISFREHLALVASTAAALTARGIGRGDRVMILAANRAEWLVTFWATVSLGAVAVGGNGWWTADEIAYALADCAPRLIVADEKRAARIGATAIPTLVMERDFAAFPEAALPDVAIGEDDPAVILYTSGTTGRPKGAVHSHRCVAGLAQLNFFHGARVRAYAAAKGAAPPPAPCVLVTSPLFHVSGLHSAAVTALAGGAKTVYPMGRFDPGTALRLMAEERVTAWAYTSALLHRLVSHAEQTGADLSSLRQLGGGGSPIAPALQARARRIAPSAAATFGVGYGLTECTALATLGFGDELADDPTCVGRPVPTVAVEIRDAHGDRLPDGVDGEIHIRSPLVMLGYHGNPEATQSSILPGRWLRTGDVGHMRDGRLWLATRARDLILRGGENIYPVEIEQRLEAHPHVAEAAVVGVAHDELGQEVKAIVVPAPGARPEPAELATWVAATLAYYKVPTHWEVRGEPLPRNATGKVLKHVLDAPAASSFIEE